MYGPNAGFENAEDGLMDRWVKWGGWAGNESEGQLSCFHGQSHLIYSPPTFLTVFYSSSDGDNA